MKLLIKDSYLVLIKNSIGTKMFRNFYAKVGSKKKDLLNKGGLSCAYFVSFVLRHFNLIKEPHLTVEGTLKDMKESGWKKTKMLKPGNVIVWSRKRGGLHKHIGFLVGKNQAISTDSKRGTVRLHHLTFKNKRRIEAVYNTKKLK